MAVSKRLRFEILRRDEHTCTYCGESAPNVTLHVDHVIPEALGGSDDASNLTTACKDCNAGKSSTAPDAPNVASVDARAAKWKDAMQRAADIERSARNGSLSLIVWMHFHWTQLFGDDYYLDHGWQQSTAKFAELGLNHDDLRYAMSVVHRKAGTLNGGHFSYFCGVCWKMISERQETARALLEGGDG